MRSYQVQGIFMPNKLTVDANANQRLDILRCPLRSPDGGSIVGGEGKELYRLFGSKTTSGKVSVDIMRGSGNNSKTLVSFSIPWNTRRIGFLLSLPPMASQLDAWKGHIPNSNIPPSIANIDHLHVCVPATSQYPTKKVLPMFMEFISHNLLLGDYGDYDKGQRSRIKRAYLLSPIMCILYYCTHPLSPLMCHVYSRVSHWLFDPLSHLHLLSPHHPHSSPSPPLIHHSPSRPHSSHTPVYIFDLALTTHNELISHNALISHDFSGAEHIYFPVPFGWGSYEMNTFVAVFQSYINEGKLSIIGQAWDGLEKFPSVLGIEIIRHNLKLIQIQTCLYYTKGGSSVSFSLSFLLLPSLPLTLSSFSPYPLLLLLSPRSHHFCLVCQLSSLRMLINLMTYLTCLPHTHFCISYTSYLPPISTHINTHTNTPCSPIHLYSYSPILSLCSYSLPFD